MIDILLVEDTIELSNLVTLFLQKEGYKVVCVDNGEAALEFFENNSARLLLLDLMLPNLDGFAVCDAVRKKGNIPIIIISAFVGKEEKLKSFALGADDYIEKPFDIDVLTAKIGALLARTYNLNKSNNIITIGEISIDTDAHKAYKNNTDLELNVKEYELLLLLMKNPGKTLNKDYMFNEIWGTDSFSENQTLTVHIKRLRNKIENNPKKSEHIQTVWGVGYKFE